MISWTRDDNNKLIPWDKEGERFESITDITYKDMQTLNENKSVYTVDICGNIPFLSCEDVSLNLIDTPGPDNPHDPTHKETQQKYLEDNAKPMMLFVLSQEYEKTDNDTLLHHIAKKMEVGGKQSKDRFMFVFNKMDQRNPDDDGSLADAIIGLKKFLEGYDIIDSNIYPISALSALDIRLVQKGKCDERLVMNTAPMVRKLNDNDFDLEQYSSLPKSLRKKLKDQADQKHELSKTEYDSIVSNAQKVENATKREEYIRDAKVIACYGNAALIHSGVPALEEAIKRYAEKYAKTAKIKMIADVINHSIENTENVQKIEDKLANAKGDKTKISKQIKAARQFIEDTRFAQEFEGAVLEQVLSLIQSIGNKTDEIQMKYQNSLSEKAIQYNVKCSIDEIQKYTASLNSLISELQPQFRNELNL